MSFVYIICGKGATEGPVKVGVTTSLKKRLACLNTASPHPLEMFAAFDAKSMDVAIKHERDMHLCLDSKRLQGEWFDVTPAFAGEVLSALTNPLDEYHKIYSSLAFLRRRAARLKAQLEAAGLEGETPEGYAEKIIAMLNGDDNVPIRPIRAAKKTLIDA
jgi:hypothetical protein